jgi:hypothetical protein
MYIPTVGWYQIPLYKNTVNKEKKIIKNNIIKENLSKLMKNKL